MGDLVSIVVTSYNHARYLPQRMDSLLAQTYPAREIIAVDDASTDGSPAILRGYEKHPQVRVVALERNGGYAAACNLGISLSNGRYIMFAECDDFNEPAHVETLAGALDANPGAGVAYCRSRMVDEDGVFRGDDFRFREAAFRSLCSRDTLIPSDRMLRFLLISCVVPNMSAALIRKDCLVQAGGLSPRYRACADWDLWCRLAESSDFYYVASPLNSFRTHSQSVRKTFDVGLQTLEIFDILNRSAAKARLTPRGKARFKVNLGLIWAGFLTSNPGGWARSFGAVLKAGSRRHPGMLLYLAIALLYKAAGRMRRMASADPPGSAA